MGEPTAKPLPWMIAAWPGMGSVALIAAGYLVQQLKMSQLGDLPADSHFDLIEVEVKEGLVAVPRLPRGVFFMWKNPGLGRDLVVFIGEAQPSSGSYAYANELLNAASRFNIERVVTFASLASGLRPAENPKVSCVATDPRTLEELRRAEVQPIDVAQIAGLNGLLLGAAAERGIAGMCLLAEIPYFAMAVPNPKAARAALSVFCVLAALDISLEELNRQAVIVDRALTEIMERIEQQHEHVEEPEADEVPAREPRRASPGKPSDDAAGSALSDADRARIERLFDDARRDPNNAVQLKSELDRLGVFKQYEGRFLDLFRRAG